jgi:hypothetical protein
MPAGQRVIVQDGIERKWEELERRCRDEDEMALGGRREKRGEGEKGRRERTLG